MFEYPTKYPQIYNEINTPEISYLLGLWWADASISYYSVQLETIKEDAEDFEKIYKRCLEYSIYNRAKRNNDKQTKTLIINNRVVCQFLQENDYGVKSKTTPYKILSKIPDELKLYFFRGWFDGDGNIADSKTGIRCLNISGTYDQDWSELEILSKKLKIKYKIRRRTQFNKKTNKYNYSSIFSIQNGEGILVFLNFIYQNVDIDNICLGRKLILYKNNFEKTLNRLVENRTLIKMIDSENNIVKIFNSLRSFQSFTGIDKRKLLRYFKSKKDLLNGYKYEKISAKEFLLLRNH